MLSAEGQGGRKCPKEQPKVPDPSPGSWPMWPAGPGAWEVASPGPRCRASRPCCRALGVGRGWPHPAVSKGRPSPAVANVCESRAAGSPGIAPAGPTVCPSTRGTRRHVATARPSPRVETWGVSLTGAHTRSPSRCSFNKINPSSFLLVCGKIHLRSIKILPLRIILSHCDEGEGEVGGWDRGMRTTARTGDRAASPSLRARECGR